MLISENFKSTPQMLDYNPRLNIVAVLEHADGTKEWFYTKNIVTIDGNKFYAQQGANETPTVDFSDANGRCELQNPASPDTPANTDVFSNVSSPISASIKALTASYPKTNDGDSDNTGAGVTVVTWAFSWTVGDFNTEAANNIYGGCIHDAAGSPIAGSKLLTHFAFGTSFEKLSTDKLKIFVNHTMLGV